MGTTYESPESSPSLSVDIPTPGGPDNEAVPDDAGESKLDVPVPDDAGQYKSDAPIVEADAAMGYLY